MRKLILKIYVRIKTWWGKVRKWIGPLEKEIQFLRGIDLHRNSISELRRVGFKYLSDIATAGLPDAQYDSLTTYKKGGDCDSLHRVIQVLEHMEGSEAYLVTYWAKPFKMCHTTCILKLGHKYLAYDYGCRTFSGTLKECVDHIANKYKSKALAFVVQDIHWRFV